jgi:DNA-binding transcriptional regulator YiaG
MTLEFPTMPCPNCGGELTVSFEDLHYTECGLPYVVLKNIHTETCGCGNVLRTIPKLAELHRLLALTLIKKNGPLENFEITYLRKSLGWSKADFARKLHVQRRMPSQWERAENPTKMSPQNDLLLRSLVAVDNRITSYLDHMEEIDVKSVKPHVHRTLEASLDEQGWHTEELAA